MSDPRRNDLSQNQASPLGATSDAYMDLMHGEGEEEEVDDFDNLGPQRASFACVTNPSNKSQAYFFCLNHYVLVDLASGPPFGTTIQGPGILVRGLPSLVSAGITGVDAALPAPGNNGELFVFRREHVVRVSFDSGELYCPTWPSSAVSESATPQRRVCPPASSKRSPTLGAGWRRLAST